MVGSVVNAKEIEEMDKRKETKEMDEMKEMMNDEVNGKETGEARKSMLNEPSVRARVFDKSYVGFSAHSPGGRLVSRSR